VGTFGDIGIFSFQYNKAMTTGEGGMIVTNERLLFKRCQAAQDIGHSRNLKGRLEMVCSISSFNMVGSFHAYFFIQKT
jgi:8-amino-3,8-dideoxy-alpha-D-manno-octulosonate transaminase